MLVKFVGGEAAGRTPYTFYKPTLGPKYVSYRPYNEFITPTTFILLVIRSVSDVLRAQSRLVKFVGGEAAGRTPYTFY